MKRLLDRDPLTRTETWHDYDPITRETTIYDVQDCEPFLERNKALATDDSRSKKGIKDSWWHVATIPNAIIHKWLAEGINVYRREDAKKVMRKLKDPEYRFLKTTPGRL